MKKHILAVPAALAALACFAPPTALAEANYVYHERSGNSPGCGGAYVSPLDPDSTQAITVRFKVEYQFYTTNACLYYTTDGTAPAGARGAPAGATRAVAATYECTFGNPVVDVATATIPAQPPGTTVRYILSAWHSGGGDEIFANGPGSPCGCGTPTNSAGKATVFSYTVPLPPPQGAIAAWDMEDGTPGAPAPSYGSGTATRGIGLLAGTPEYALGNSPSPGKAWMVKGFAATESSAVSGNDFVEIAVSTVGFSGIWFAFDGSGSSAFTARVRYSTDGTTFVPASSTHAVGASWGGSIFYVDLSAVAALDNNPNAKFRIYGWSSSSANTLSIDNVGVFGSRAAVSTALVSASSVVTTPVAAGTASTVYRHVVVNNNRTSPYYGYVYVNDQRAGEGIHIYRPNPESAGTAATSYTDTGWTVQSDLTGTPSATGIALAGDDYIWSVYRASANTIVQRSAHPTLSSPAKLSTTAFQSAQLDSRVGVKSMCFSGSTSDGSARVYLDNSTTTVGAAYRAGFKQNPSGGWDPIFGFLNTDLGYGSGGVTDDETGMVYFAKPIAAGNRECFYRYSSAGTLLANIATAPSWLPNTDMASCTRYGNYLYYSALAKTAKTELFVLCFDLKGQFVWGFGPPLAGAPSDGTYRIVSLSGESSGAYPAYIAVDDRGNVYLRNYANGYASISKILRPALRKAVGAPITSSPVALGGVTYFGADGGKVYAVDSDTGAAVSGFPVDLTAAAGGMAANSGRKVLGRVAYRSIEGLGYLFLTTSDGCVVRLRADNGQIGWAVQRIAAAGLDTTPAVVTTDTGTMGQAAAYVAVTDGTSVARVDKLSAEDGSLLAQSPNLGTSGSLSISSPSVNGAGVFVSLTGAAAAAYRLNLSNLWPQQQVGVGESAFGSPFMTPSYSTYPRVVIGTASGTMSAYNATNGGVEFQNVDITPAGSPALSTPYVYGGTAYFGGGDGVIYQASVADGSAPLGGYVFYAGAAGTSVSGLAIDPAGISGQPSLCFGDSAGRYHKVLIGDPAKSVVIPAGAGGFTTPTIDAAASAVLLGNADSSLYRLERR